jgi:hypothetical protein
MNRVSKAVIWAVFWRVMLAMTWKGQRNYREYCAFSDGWNSLAAACRATSEKPCLSLHAWNN